MPQGLEIYNENGFLQIGSDYINVSVIQSGTWSASSAQGSGAIVFPAQGYRVPVQVWARPVNNNQWFGDFILTNSGFDYLTPNPDRFHYSSQGPCEYRVCSLTGPFSEFSGNVGLQCWTSSGALAFDSRRKYPRVRGILSVQSASGSGAALQARTMTNLQAGAGRPWMLMNQLPFWNIGDTMGREDWSLYCRYTSDSTCQFGEANSTFPPHNGDNNNFHTPFNLPAYIAYAHMPN